MRILFNDLIQKSDAPAALKTPALSETYRVTDGTFTITLEKLYNNLFPIHYIDCFGIGYTDATYISLTFNAIDKAVIDNGNANSTVIFEGDTDYSAVLQSKYEAGCIFDAEAQAFSTEATAKISIKENGLYMMPKRLIKSVTATTDATYIGRFGLGKAVHLGTAHSKEPGLSSTAESRRTMSGQIIPGRGGYSYRTLNVDTRYKIGYGEMREIEDSYAHQLGEGYPLFILFDDEQFRLPFYRLYARDTKGAQYVFQSSINKFLFSKAFEFEECF